MRPRNETATALLAALEKEGIEPVSGYFAGAEEGRYCVGVRVDDPAAAFTLGSKLGPEFGEVSFDFAWGWQGFVIVFRDAHVTA